MGERVRVLVVDDEDRIRETLCAVLEDEGYQTAEAGDGETALKFLTGNQVDILLLDIWLPGLGGMEVLARVREEYPAITVIMISGHGTVHNAVDAIKRGAFDFIEKPLSIDRLLLVLEKARKIRILEDENRSLKGKVGSEHELIGSSAEMERIRGLIQSAGASNGRVLISGDNGTGKEVVARSIHLASQRRDLPFIDVNCAAIPETLIESELFGHEKGAFTGAVEMRRGKFEQADRGTIFLDEIADMSLQTQAKVLRVLQEMSFERVGGSKTLTVDVRVIAATNKDLQAEMGKGNFREDLFYRLNVIPIQLPALKDRKGDLVELVSYFSERFCLLNARKVCEFTPEAIELLKSYDWPGNVRELKNVIERAIIMLSEEVIDRGGLRQFFHEVKPEPSSPEEEELVSDDFQNLKEARDAFEKRYIIRILEENEMNVSQTARVLGIERSNLYRKISSLGIKV